MRVFNNEEPNVVAQPQTAELSTVLYRERQWVPGIGDFCFYSCGHPRTPAPTDLCVAHWPLVIQSAIAVWPGLAV